MIKNTRDFNWYVPLVPHLVINYAVKINNACTRFLLPNMEIFIHYSASQRKCTKKYIINEKDLNAKQRQLLSLKGLLHSWMIHSYTYRTFLVQHKTF